MAIHHGTTVSWGVGTTIVGVSGLFQQRERLLTCETERILDYSDRTVSKAYWDPWEEATFTYVPSWGTTGAGNAPITHPKLSAWVYVDDTVNTRIIGWWLCDAIREVSSNTNATRVILTLTRHPYITRYNNL